MRATLGVASPMYRFWRCMRRWRGAFAGVAIGVASGCSSSLTFGFAQREGEASPDVGGSEVTSEDTDGWGGGVGAGSTDRDTADGGTTGVTGTTSTGTAEGDTGAPASDEPSPRDDVIEPPDVGLPRMDCSTWSNDCPTGQRCLRWDFDGDGDAEGSRCLPIRERPMAVGEPCVVFGEPGRKDDNCGAGALCLNPDSERGVGTCVAYCVGDPETPTCTDPAQICEVSESGLALCRPPPAVLPHDRAH